VHWRLITEDNSRPTSKEDLHLGEEESSCKLGACLVNSESVNKAELPRFRRA